MRKDDVMPNSIVGEQVWEERRVEFGHMFDKEGAVVKAAWEDVAIRIAR